jgi:hypothetical protein
MAATLDLLFTFIERQLTLIMQDLYVKLYSLCQEVK